MSNLHLDFIDYKKIFKDQEKRLKVESKLAFIPDKPYLKMVYWIKTGHKLNLNNPLTFSEKINWLKINDQHEKYTNFVDKYYMKKFISKKYGTEYVIPLLGVWDHFEEINFDQLPNQFVLKCTHDSGSIKIIKDKYSVDKKALKKFYDGRLSINPFCLAREYPYKNVKPRIIAEKYHEMADGRIINDYRFFCFNGEPKIIYVVSDRNRNETENWFDVNFEPLNIIDPTTPNKADFVEKPVCFNEMLQFAKELSSGIKLVRVDLYEDNGKFFFGEMTFFPYGGFIRLQPEEWEYKLGSWIDLDNPKVIRGGYCDLLTFLSRRYETAVTFTEVAA